MAVGAGSIKRAAKANLEVSNKTEPSAKENVLVEGKVNVENDKALEQVGQQESSLKELAHEKQESDKKVIVKKTAKKGASSAKKKDTIINKKESVVEENTRMNQVCHITEDLPIYLL